AGPVVRKFVASPAAGMDPSIEAWAIRRFSRSSSGDEGSSAPAAEEEQESTHGGNPMAGSVWASDAGQPVPASASSAAAPAPSASQPVKRFGGPAQPGPFLSLRDRLLRPMGGKKASGAVTAPAPRAAVSERDATLATLRSATARISAKILKAPGAPNPAAQALPPPQATGAADGSGVGGRPAAAVRRLSLRQRTLRAAVADASAAIHAQSQAGPGSQATGLADATRRVAASAPMAAFTTRLQTRLGVASGLRVVRTRRWVRLYARFPESAARSAAAAIASRRLDFDRDDSAPGGSSGATAPWREFQGWMTSAAVDAECERMRAEATVQGGEADAEFAIDEAAALLGIAQWTSGRYLVLASTAAEVGSVGQHSVFGVSEVALVPLQWRQVAPKGVLSSMAQMLGLGTAQRAEGSFTAGIAAALSKPFALFFSRGFDLTRPLQNQVTVAVVAPSGATSETSVSSAAGSDARSAELITGASAVTLWIAEGSPENSPPVGWGEIAAAGIARPAAQPSAAPAGAAAGASAGASAGAAHASRPAARATSGPAGADFGEQAAAGAGEGARTAAQGTGSAAAPGARDGAGGRPHGRPQDPGPVSCPPREMFVWNHSLLEPLAGTVSPGWATPVICGSFGQVSVSSFSKPMVLSLVSRRSRHFAGTRYFKRGVSRLGFVANEVELEQMVDDTAGGIASFVQLRGSVPLPWVQRTSVRVPKPPISMAPPDPTSLTGARQHFASLLARHGAPILCLNLLRKGSRAAREGPLGASFADAVKTVNSTLPPALRLQFASLDFASLSKSRSHHVLTALRASSEWAVANTGVFVAAPGKGGSRSASLAWLDGGGRQRGGCDWCQPGIASGGRGSARPAQKDKASGKGDPAGSAEQTPEGAMAEAKAAAFARLGWGPWWEVDPWPLTGSAPRAGRRQPSHADVRAAARTPAGQ
ncbi:SAC1, partial [Symbiodinium sp. KB8]